jgi:GNAT superfamily N-acetyltransferase
VTRYTLRPLIPADKPIVMPLLVREWASVDVMGLLTYLVRGDAAELVTINAFAGGGVGSALVGALVEECRALGVRRVNVTTTNDNTRALRFYQREGFRLTALRIGAIEESRKIKPEIPSHGIDGIPIRDEIELTKELP